MLGEGAPVEACKVLRLCRFVGHNGFRWYHVRRPEGNVVQILSMSDHDPRASRAALTRLEVEIHIQTVIDQRDRGEGIDGGTVLAELKQKSEALRKTRKGE